MKKWLIGVVICCAVLGLGSNGCLKGEKGESGSSGAPALISFNSYAFISNANPYMELINEIDLDGVENGWQTVTVYAWWATDEWAELPVTQGDGSTVEVDLTSAVGDGYVELKIVENGVVNDPPTGGYVRYMVIVHTFAH